MNTVEPFEDFNDQVAYKLNKMLPQKPYRKLIYSTHTKPLLLEVYFFFTERFTNRMGLYFIFRIVKLHSKQSKATVIAEYPLYIRNARVFLDIAHGLRKDTLFDTYFLYEKLHAWIRLKWVRGERTDALKTSKESRSREAVLKEFSERIADINDRGAFVCNVYRDNSADPTKECTKRRILTLDYHPVRMNGETSRKPWVLGIQEFRKEHRKGNSFWDNQKKRYAWNHNKSTELWLSSKQLCDLADSIYESVMCWDDKEINLALKDEK